MKLTTVVAETLALVGVGGCLCDYGLSDLALIALMLGLDDLDHSTCWQLPLL
jgi:hypothetical protein